MANDVNIVAMVLQWLPYEDMNPVCKFEMMQQIRTFGDEVFEWPTMVSSVISKIDIYFYNLIHFKTWGQRKVN